jgi:N-acetylglucosamine-6-phosphate deacetylase
MSVEAIFASRAFTPLDEIADPVVLVDGQKIVAIGRKDEIPVPASANCIHERDLTIVPGFIDVHIHGAAGHDVMEGTHEALAAITTSVVTRGTTALLATTVSASEVVTCTAIEAVANWIKQRKGQSAAAPASAEILGVHLEGPFISLGRRGAHPAEWIVAPSVPLFERYLETAKGTTRILTLAPELPGADEVIAEASKVGVVISLGHTDASYAQAMAAIANGARHATHVFNAMRPFTHRETGVVGAVLTSPNVTAELIADGVHVDDAAIRVLLATKGARGVILVSDGISATGMPDGTYKLGTSEVGVAEGIARTSEGKLAGSTLTLDRALRHLLGLGLPPREVLPMLTSNPARLLGLEHRKGSLQAGADADLLLLDDHFELAGVMARGAWLNQSRTKDSAGF